MIAGNLTELQGAIEHQVVRSKDDADAAVPFNEFLAAVATITDADQPRQLSAAEVAVEQVTDAEEPIPELDVAAFIHPIANPRLPATEAVAEISVGATTASPATDITLDPITATITTEITATGQTHSPPITPGNQLNLERVIDDQALPPQPAGPHAWTDEPTGADALAVEAEQAVPQHQAVTGDGTTLDGVVAVDQPELTLRQVAPTSQQHSDTSRAQIDEDKLTVEPGPTEVEPLSEALNGLDASSERENSSDAALSPQDDGFASQPQRSQDPTSAASPEIPEAIASPNQPVIRAEASIENRPVPVADIGTASTPGSQARNVTEQVVSAMTQVIEAEDGSSVKTMFLELNPADLGRLKIQVEQTAESVAAQIIASELVSSDLLASKKEALLEALSNLGFKDASVDISHQESNQSDSQTPSAWRGQDALNSADVPPAVNQHVNVYTSHGLNIVV